LVFRSIRKRGEKNEQNICKLLNYIYIFKKRKKTVAAAAATA
jgi:hypothetical protein